MKFGSVLFATTFALLAANAAHAKTCISHYAATAKFEKLEDPDTTYTVKEADLGAIHEVHFDPEKIRDRVLSLFPNMAHHVTYCDVSKVIGNGVPYSLPADVEARYRIEAGLDPMPGLGPKGPSKPGAPKASGTATLAKTATEEKWEAAHAQATGRKISDAPPSMGASKNKPAEDVTFQNEDKQDLKTPPPFMSRPPDMMSLPNGGAGNSSFK
jgi:hypothetical protein